jgi:hypothetical protein
MTVSSRVIQTFLQWRPDAADVPLLDGLKVQILPTMADLPRARKHQFAAFVAQEGLLVVWEDEPMQLVDRAAAIESGLMALVWNSRDEVTPDAEKKLPNMEGIVIDAESGQKTYPQRPRHMQNTVLVTLTLILIITTLGAGARSLAIEIAIDHNYFRLALLLLTPIQVFFTLFFAQVVLGCLAQLFGPVKQLTTNSKFYSALPPQRLSSESLPHVTIQMPVYKEGLKSVIMPTVKSIKAAMSTYELQGGTSNIFINDDGMQIISAEERQARIDYYADQGIGWVARPPDGEAGFKRRGKFKKASNMNYGLHISCLVEDELATFDRAPGWTQADETELYEGCLRKVLEEKAQAWAEGNIRVGDYILLSEHFYPALQSMWLTCTSRFRYPSTSRLLVGCCFRDGTVTRSGYSSVLVWRHAGGPYLLRERNYFLHASHL